MFTSNLFRWKIVKFAVAGTSCCFISGFAIYKSAFASEKEVKTTGLSHLDSFKFPTYPSYLNLKQVQVIHRHGDRSPLSSIPNGFSPVEFICNTETKGKCIHGELTPKGKHQLFTLGSKLRELYINRLKFLNQTLVPEDLFSTSTDFPRTRESLRQLLFGLYPRETREGKSVIITLTEPSTLYQDYECAKYIDGTKQHARTATELEYREKHVEPLKKELKEFLTFPDGKQVTLTEIFDHITCRKSHNMPIPKIFDEEMTKKIIAVSARHWWYPFIADRQIARLGIGRLVSDVVSQCEKTISGKSTTKFAVYSGHDSTVAPFLGAIKAPIGNIWPPYSSFVIVELLQDKRNSEHVVRVIYNGEVQKFAGYEDGFIPFSDFKKHVEDAIPKNFHVECKEK